MELNNTIFTKERSTDMSDMSNLTITYWTDHTYINTPDVPLFVARAGREPQPPLHLPQGLGEYQLLIVTEGMGIFERTGETLMLPKGSVMLFAPGTPLFYHPIGKSWETAWLTFVGSEVNALVSLPFGIYQAKNLSYIEDRVTEILLLPKEQRQSKGQRILRDLLLSLPSLLVQPMLSFSKSEKNTAFLTMLKYIEEHLAERITLLDLQRISGCGKTKVNDLFRRNVRMSPMQYIIHLRMRTAEEFLKSHPEMSISEIAEKCGFRSLSYYDQCFALNMSPREFRKQYQSKTALKK